MLAFLTSRFTLDAPSGEPVRRHLREQSDLVAAVRLPSGLFSDTAVVADLVILRKRMDGEAAADDTWVHTIRRTYAYQPPSGARHRYKAPQQVESDLNAYFAAHPDMVLGVQAAASTMHGIDYSVALPEGGGEAVSASLLERMRALPEGVLSAHAAPTVGTSGRPSAGRSIAPGPTLKEGAHAVVGDAVVCRSGQLVDPLLPPAQEARLRALLTVRDAARDALRAQLDGASPQLIEETQRRLNAVYDQVVFRYGPMNAQANVAAMAADPDAFFLRALERWDAEAQHRHRTGRPVADQAARERLKMPLFHEIVVRQAWAATHARSVRDAFLITLNELGRPDFGYIAELLGAGAHSDIVRDELAAEGLVFEDPEAGWQTADAYLSGNVKHKLRVAERAARAEPRFLPNVEALHVVIPPDIAPGQIEVRLGTHWIPTADVNDFLFEVLGAEEPRWSRAGNQFVRCVSETAEWVVEVQPIVAAAKNFGDWGTHRAAAIDIVLDLLNGRLPKVVDELEDGRRVVNQQETLAAQEKGEALQRRFVEWLWSDADRSERLARFYNDTFNAIRPRDYDGSHLTLPGSNPSFTLTPPSASRSPGVSLAKISNDVCVSLCSSPKP